jgi:hypothetical protein
MSYAEDTTPEDLLLTVAEKVDRIESEMAIQTEYRIDLARADAARECLRYLRENGRATTPTIRDGANVTDASRPLSKLYHSHYVNRSGGKPYEYEISDIGRRALDEYDAEMQQTIPEANGDADSSSENPKPWHNTELNRSQYIALRCVADYDGRPRPEDINPKYLKQTDASSHENGYAISSRLFELVDMGYLGRPPGRPYVYWLTDDGQDVLADD